MLLYENERRILYEKSISINPTNDIMPWVIRVNDDSGVGDTCILKTSFYKGIGSV